MKKTLKKCFDTIKHIFLFVLVLITGNTYHVFKRRPVKNLVIFIHGTLMPALAVLNPFKAYGQDITNKDWYYRCLQKVRKNPIVYEDTIMLEEGLQKIDATILENYKTRTLNPALCKRGAYQAIGAYHSLSSFLSQDTSSRSDYYTWGFSGVLSDLHRRNEAERLYNDLVQLRDQYLEQGYNVQFTLCGYSHGGNVVLYLADAEKKQNRKLSIDTAVLYATPLYKETVQRGYDTFFKTIINCYSHGDSVQVADQVSIPERKAFRSFSSVACEPIDSTSCPSVIDIEIAVGDDAVFDHHSFWCLRSYSASLFSSHPEATASVLKSLQPLPLAVLTPCILSVLRSNPLIAKQRDQIKLSLKATATNFILEATNCETNLSVQSCDILPILQAAQDYALQTWQPHAHTSDAGKYALGFLTALRTILD